MFLFFRIIIAEPLKDKVEGKLDTLADKDVDSTDSAARYMAYGARLRTVIRAGHRYIAYVSLRGYPSF